MVLKCAYVMIYMYELRKQMQHSVGRGCQPQQEQPIQIGC